MTSKVKPKAVPAIDNRDPRQTGSLGGRARAVRMSAKARSASSSRAATARWSVAREIAAGSLTRIPGVTIPCAVLDNETRVLSTRGVSRAFGSKKTGTDTTGTGAPQPPPFLTSAAMKPFLSDELIVLLNSPIVYLPKIGGRTAYGYDCTVLPLICKAVVAADRDGALGARQAGFAAAAQAILDALVGVAMIALVDEATGYQYRRDRDALARELERFINKKLASWVKTFPDEYYERLATLRGIKVDDHHRPQYFGNLTNDLIYSRLAPGVLAELQEKNPPGESGRRRARHHQWLSRDLGHPALREHIAVTCAFMKISPSYEKLIEQLDHVAPRQRANLYLLSYDQMQPPPTPNDDESD